MTTASTQLVQSGTDNGVAWRIDTYISASQLRATRWHTTATRLEGGFLLLAQVVPGSAEPSSDFAAGLASHGILHMLQYGGIFEQELPGWDVAVPLQSGNELLHTHFLIRTSNPQAAQAWLTPAIASVLAEWAAQVPIQNLQPLSQERGALYVVVRPDGLWLIHIPALEQPILLDGLSGLGRTIARHAIGSIVAAPGYNCPNCGGPGLRPTAPGMLVCTYCGGQFAAPQPIRAAPRGTHWLANRIPSTRSVFAMLSLISGIVAWTLVPFVGALLAVAFGVQGFREIRASQGQIHGSWLAAIGVVLGVTQLLIVCLFIALLVFAGITTPS